MKQFFDNKAFISKIANKLNSTHTKYIWINPRKYTACWKCLTTCPNQVIGKVGFLWHKHIVIKAPNKCFGCKKCIKTCQRGIFSEIKK